MQVCYEAGFPILEKSWKLGRKRERKCRGRAEEKPERKLTLMRENRENWKGKMIILLIFLG